VLNIYISACPQWIQKQGGVEAMAAIHLTPVRPYCLIFFTTQVFQKPVVPVDRSGGMNVVL
jgi:hypothetical protein